MMKNYDKSVEINKNPNWPYIPDHPYRILKSDSHLPKKFPLFASLNALKALFILKIFKFLS